MNRRRAGRREVTEGVFSVEALASLARSLNIEMPITEALDRVLNRGADLDLAIEDLLARLSRAGLT